MPQALVVLGLDLNVAKFRFLRSRRKNVARMPHSCLPGMLPAGSSKRKR